MINFRKILLHYNIDTNSQINEYGNGLINKTFLVTDNHSKNKFILQQVNCSVFRCPPDIDSNISLIRKFLSDSQSDYYISLPLITSKNNISIIEEDGEFYRVFNFLENTSTYDTISDANQAYQASNKFGEFTATLKVDPNLLKITIPDFHNLQLRVDQFSESLISGEPSRLRETKHLISKITTYNKILDEYTKIKNSPCFKKRITHHDTKISNVLFDYSGKAVSVIDLDTVMRGYFISDFGDMMRTYLSPVSEEHKEYSEIYIRKEIYLAIKEGYLDMMGSQLSTIEKEHLFYSGQFMVYMQALRFLTDYLNMDKYYGSKYEGQNFIRASNQLTLLERLYEFERSLY